MGFNTVVLILNDYMHELEKSPKTLAWALTHPPMGGPEELRMWWKTVHHVADDNEERRLSQSAVKILPTFHMDFKQLVAVGRNSIEPIKIIKEAEYDAHIELPSWWK